MGNMGLPWKVSWLAAAFIMAQVIVALAADAPPDGAQSMPGAQRVWNRELLVATASTSSDVRAAHSDSASTPERQALDHLLEGSGLKGQLASLSASVRAQFLQSAMRDQDRVTIDRIVSARFDTEALYARITLELAHNTDAPKLGEALQWYESPLGRCITALELAAARLEGGRDASVGSDRDRPSPGRVALVERLDAGLGASETTVDVTVAIVRSLVRAFQPALPALATLNGGQLDEQLALARNRTLALLRPTYIAGMLVAYRRLSNAELGEYLRFVESAAGQWYMSQTNSAVLKAVDVAAGVTAAELATVLPPLAAELR
jgi:hypothetical protein